MASDGHLGAEDLKRLAWDNRRAAAQYTKFAVTHGVAANFWERRGDWELTAIEERAENHAREGARIALARAEIMERRAGK